MLAGSSVQTGNDPVTWTGSHTWSKAGPQVLSNADSQWLIGQSTDPGWTIAAVQIGARTSLFAAAAGTTVLAQNLYTDGTQKAIATANVQRILMDGTNIDIETAPSTTAGVAPTFTRAIRIADPGLVAIGRSAATSTAAILKIGADSGTGDYDLLGGTDVTAIVLAANLRMNANATNHNGFRPAVISQNDGSARTVTNQYTASFEAPRRDNATTTVTNSYTGRFDNPTLGVTVNRPINNPDSLSFLSTAGIWTDNSSRGTKDILERLDSLESFKARLVELKTLVPVKYRWKADHLIHPVRTLTPEIRAQYAREGLFAPEREAKAAAFACGDDSHACKYNELTEVQKGTVLNRIESEMTLAQLNSKGVATDAMWSTTLKEYMAFRFGRWEVVGSDAKEEEIGVIAEEMPLLARTKDGKGFNPVSGFAWLTEVCKAQQDLLDRQREIISALEVRLIVMEMRLLKPSSN